MLLPGLGAVYNRQNVKALVHFLTVAGLFQLKRLDILGMTFFLGGVAFYIYSIIDAYRTAQLITQGESPAADEERFKRGLTGNAPVIGLVLLAAGGLMMIQFFQPAVASLVKLAPVALILLGGYFLASHFKKTRDGGYEPNAVGRPPYRLVPGQVAGPQVTQETHTWRQR